MAITLQQRQNAWAVLASTASRARDLADSTAAEITKIRESNVWADRHKAEQIQHHQEGLAGQLQDLTVEATQARDLLVTAARELDQPAGDSTAQLLAETRRGRAWDRIRPQLDVGRPLGEILDAAERDQDAAALAALRTELPSWVEARAPRPGGLASLGSQPTDVSGLLRRLDIAAARSLGDDKGIGTAARLRLHAETMYPLAEAHIAIARDGRTLQTTLAAKMAQQGADAVQAELNGATMPNSSGDAA